MVRASCRGGHPVLHNLEELALDEGVMCLWRACHRLFGHFYSWTEVCVALARQSHKHLLSRALMFLLRHMMAVFSSVFF